MEGFSGREYSLCGRFLSLLNEVQFSGQTTLASPKQPMDVIEQSKRLAAYQAVDNHVLSEHKVGDFWDLATP